MKFNHLTFLPIVILANTNFAFAQVKEEISSPNKELTVQFAFANNKAFYNINRTGSKKF